MPFFHKSKRKNAGLLFQIWVTHPRVVVHRYWQEEQHRHRRCDCRPTTKSFGSCRHLFLQVRKADNLIIKQRTPMKYFQGLISKRFLVASLRSNRPREKLENSFLRIGVKNSSWVACSLGKSDDSCQIYFSGNLFNFV